jgi:hypothetical protein
VNRRGSAKESVLGRRCALLGMLLVLALSGCYRSTPPGAAIVGGKVGRGGFTFLRWKQGLAIMIWHDLASSSSQGSDSTGDPVYHLSSHALSSDGRRVDWQAQTTDGKTAQFWIDGESYDLASGALFIVTTQNGATMVNQLHRDLSNVQPDYDSCVDFARGDPDLARFMDGLSDSQTETQISGLVDRAREHLQAQLGVRREDIQVTDIQPLESLCHDPGLCAEGRPGHIIRLVAEGQVYEYRARILGKVCVLWREVKSEPMAALPHGTAQRSVRQGQLMGG